MRKNKLFKKAVAVIAAACTLFSATGFSGTTVKAESFETIGVNGTKSGCITKIDRVSTNDYYTFVTDATDSYYRINMKAYDGDGYIEYWVYSDIEMTEEVAYNYLYDGNTHTKDFCKDLKPSTQYFVRVSGGLSTDALSYQLQIEKYSTDDYGDERTDLQAFAVGQVQTGINNHCKDVDYFTFITDSTDSFYYLDTKATTNSNRTYIYYQIFTDSEMTDSIFNEYIYTGESVTFDLKKELKPSKQYYIKVYGGDGMNQANYQMKVRKVADDVHDTVDNGKTLSLNNACKQKIENASDVDCFKFTTSNYTDYNLTFKSTSNDGFVEYYIYSDRDMTNEIKHDYFNGKNYLRKDNASIQLTPYKTYYVKVTGRENSNYTVGINATAPVNSKPKSATINKKKQITINWSKVNKATGYEVYRSEKGGKYKKVATIKSAKTIKWIDKKVKNGNTYKYKVRAYAKVNGKVYYSAYSSEKSIKVK